MWFQVQLEDGLSTLHLLSLHLLLKDTNFSSAGILVNKYHLLPYSKCSLRDRVLILVMTSTITSTRSELKVTHSLCFGSGWQEQLLSVPATVPGVGLEHWTLAKESLVILPPG